MSSSSRSPRRFPAVGRFLLLPLFFTSIVVLLAHALVWQAPGPYIASIVLGLGAASAIFLTLIYKLFPIVVHDG